VGLLLLLPVPAQVWSDISIDFVEGLPKVSGKSVILTVVDRLSKYAHFIPLAHPYTVETVARVFFAEIVRPHGIPTSIVSDRDLVFTSAFWQALFRVIGSKLHMSSAFHPQSDGQTEAVNKTIGMYLRCMTVHAQEFGLRGYHGQNLFIIHLSIQFSRKPCLNWFMGGIHLHSVLMTVERSG
jgi:transposase InsO family protein